MSITIVLYFVLYACIGWLCETIYVSVAKGKLVKRGFLYGPLCPIYGFGAILILFILNPLSAYPYLVFILGMILCSILEYLTSWIMELIFHVRWWDYSTYKFNIHGRVCLKNSLMFGVLGIILVYGIHPLLHLQIEKIPIVLQITIASILFILLCIDVVLSTLAALDIHKILHEVEVTLDAIKTKQEALSLQHSKEILEHIETLKKRHAHFIRAFPTLQHRTFVFDTKGLDELKQKLKKISL